MLLWKILKTRFKSMQLGKILTVNVLVLQETLQKSVCALWIGNVVLLSKAVQFLWRLFMFTKDVTLHFMYLVSITRTFKLTIAFLVCLFSKLIHYLPSINAKVAKDTNFLIYNKTHWEKILFHITFISLWYWCALEIRSKVLKLTWVGRSQQKYHR